MESVVPHMISLRVVCKIVYTNVKTSTVIPINYGAPQSSILVPFLCYILMTYPRPQPI